MTDIFSRLVSFRSGWRANRPGFGVIYSFGKTYPFWWDTETHIYAPLTAAQRSHFHLERLEEITQTIAAICGLNLFSTEIAMTQDGNFWVLDYVNDPLDLKAQSKAAEGVPDEMLEFIAEDLAGWLGERLHPLR